MKTLFVVESPVKKENYINTMPPLGVLYMSSYLTSKGIENDVVDCNVEELNKDINDYDLVALSVNCGNITNTIRTARKIKKEFNKTVIVGGAQATSNPKFFLKQDFIDGVVKGEGEITLHEYITKKDVVDGLYLKKDGKIFYKKDREWNRDLDSLPFPALDKVDLKKYNVPIKKKKPASTLVTSRGCPYQCIFCFHPNGYIWRARSAENVVDEIEWQVNNFGVKEVCIQDDNISLDLDRAKKIFDLVKERDIDVLFQLYNGIRVDRLDEELMKKMKDNGLWLMNISPEVGYNEGLRKIKKNFTLDTVRKSMKMSKDFDFFTYSNYMLGFPWEGREEMEKTINFAVELDADMNQFARVLPFPNTELYDMVGLKGDIEGDSGLFFSDEKFNISKLKTEEINEYIKKAYRKCYFKPRKMWKILKNLRKEDIYALAKYSLLTESV
tara:strand:+ start:534 stop:1856 length:1323 start_codon:yes stop_codon:yes gene_type:complete